MDRLAGSRSKTDDENDVFHLLLKLYAHQDVVEQLYSSYDANAAEFEFYIPQLCTFLLHGNYAKQHQLECFLMSRSGESLPFAHRLTWFLRSICDNAKEYQSEYLSVTASQDQENSDLLTAIGRRAGVPALLMNSGLCVEEVSAAKPDNLQRRRSIIFPTDSELDSTTLETDESFAGHLLSKRNSIQDEARTDEGNSQQISLFKQTPKFVEALTDLAVQLIPTPRPRRNSKLRKGLNEIQEQMLPSDVIYLPIGNSYHRVKGIQVDECFTFSTKERVPYFLCVEVLDYSVPSHTSSSKKPRKRKKSKASRNQSRVFSLKLPFTNTGVDLTMTVDDSPMSSSTSPESELSLIPSPSVTSPLPEIEEEKGPIVSDSSTPLQETGEAPTDGEYGDDEKEGDARKSRKSFQEDESLQKAEEEQQERLGQWNLPRPRRRSIKEYSSSASARSGGQFDSFYSSWFSKKTQQEDDENCDATDAQPTTEDVSENVSDEGKIESFDSTEMVPEETKNEEAGSITAEELPIVVKSVPVPVLSTVISNSDVENNNLNDAVTESKPEANKTTSTKPSSMAPESSAPTAKAGIFSTLFYKQPKPVVENAHQSTLLSSDQKNHESAPCQELPGADVPKPGSLGTSAASSAPTQSLGLFSTLFSKKASEALVPSSSSTVPSTLAKDNSKSGEATASSSEECEATPEDVETQSVVVHTEPVGIFSSLFAKKTQQITEATALDADGAASVSSLEPSEEGALDDLDAEDADGEESESKEALPPDNDPAADDVSSLEQNEQDFTDDLDAEDADSEDTDSNGALFSDDECITCEPEPSPAKVPSEKQTSFVSWFSRKPAAEVAVDTGVATVKATVDTEANACANDNAASPKRADATEDAGSSEPSAHVVEDKNAAQDEVLPAQRPRDLSVSLDFADPTAWKEKFDLEDGLTDDEPDVETADTDVVDADANEELGESDDDDEKPMIVFRERWSEKESRIRRESPFGDHPGWRLLSVIVKSNDDLRQEQFAAQLIAQCDRIFREYALPLSLRPYNVIATSAKTGLIEAVPDTVSLDSLKRNDPGYTTLLYVHSLILNGYGPSSNLSYHVGIFTLDSTAILKPLASLELNETLWKVLLPIPSCATYSRSKIGTTAIFWWTLTVM
ncbi:unnamed protein product [Phytophthora lilii]|uniref:Unnamed protein product n=1 Tax=Phytophthora lilii TaxID=2077276 RepID=A0A9W6TWD6_9STRA|nr:unnamed protein product [Phytophthora lilii]